MRLFIVAAEPSGDELGAKLIHSLLEKESQIEITGIGGKAMAGAGIASSMDISGLSILGFVEGLKHYPMIMKKVKICSEHIMQSGADGVILIDSWGFMVRVAKHLKKMGFQGKIIKYVAPQVWAMRAGRAKILAKYVDLLLSIQPMDAPYFEAEGLETHYVGNPVFDTDYSVGNEVNFRSRFKLANRQVLSVWFGSRQSEVEQLTSVFCAAIMAMRAEYPKLAIVAPISASVEAAVKSRIEDFGITSDILFVDETDKIDAMSASTAALACSGTVTSQLASAGVPTIVAYRLNKLTYWAAKHLFKPDYVSIVNIAANAPLMPEFIQEEANGLSLSKALMSYFKDDAMRDEASAALLRQTKTMGAGSGQMANEKAASVILTALKPE